MRNIRILSPVAVGAFVLLLSGTPASAGLFRGPYDFSLGPYRGEQPWSYFESYNYFGVTSIPTYPYFATGVYNYFWESPFTWGSGSRYPSFWPYPRRPGVFNPINPGYLTPPRAPGYTKESSQDVVL